MSALSIKGPDAVARDGSASPVLSASALRLSRIAAAAMHGYPREACGVLIGRFDGGVAWLEHAIEGMKSERQTEGERYVIAESDRLQAEQWAAEHGLEVIGFWFSHSDEPPVPSKAHAARAVPGFSYLIVSVDRRRQIALRSWRFDGDRFIEEKLES